MDDQIQCWEPILAGLDGYQLLSLRQEIDKRLAQHHGGRDSEDQITLNPKHATFYSNTSTLYHSGQSTPKAWSICSDNVTLGLPISQGDGIDQSSTHSTGIEPHEWPQAASNHYRQPQSSLRQDALRKTINKPEPNSVPPQYFCTFCLEMGERKIIKRKEDWKRHEEDYHFGTGNQWTCPVGGCSSVFYRGVDLTKHLKNDHKGKKYPRDSKDKHQLIRTYACGFENCRELNDTWKDHCDHVALHMLKGHTNWTYDRTIRVLLKHPNLSAQWKQTYTTLCPQLPIMHNELTWDVLATRHMREQLEFQNFGGHLEGFLQRLFLVGIPSSKARDFVGQPPLPNIDPSSQFAVPPSLPPVMPSPVEFLNIDPSFGGLDVPLSTDATNIEMQLPSQHRNSVFMLDAPSHDASDPQLEAHPSDPLEEIPSRADEEITFETFVAETAPDHDTPFTDQEAPVAHNSKPHSPRLLMRKSKEWLTAKKSHHSQPTAISHPDLPANMHLPTASHRKKSNASHRMHNGHF